MLDRWSNSTPFWCLNRGEAASGNFYNRQKNVNLTITSTSCRFTLLSQASFFIFFAQLSFYPRQWSGLSPLHDSGFLSPHAWLDELVHSEHTFAFAPVSLCAPLVKTKLKRSHSLSFMFFGCLILLLPLIWETTTTTALAIVLQQHCVLQVGKLIKATCSQPDTLFVCGLLWM